MRKLIQKLALLSFVCHFSLVNAQVGIGTTTPSNAAMLEVSGGDVTTGYRGFMPARVPTDEERDLIAPSETDNGLLVFVESSGCLNIWTGTLWEEVYCSGAGDDTSTLVAVQDFETTPAIPTLNFATSGFGVLYTAAVTTGLYPSVTNFPSDSQVFGVNNGVVTIDFGPIDASGFSAVDLSFRLAALSGNPDNGNDQGDFVEVLISTDGGISFSSEIVVTGNDNARWNFEGTGVVGVSYNGINVPGIFQTAPGGNGPANDLTGNEALSTIRVLGISNSPDLRVRIILTNNFSEEYWLIDDVQLTAQ